MNWFGAIAIVSFVALVAGFVGIWADWNPWLTMGLVLCGLPSLSWVWFMLVFALWD